MVRYNIYDLLSPKCKEKLDFITAKQEIIIDEQLLNKLNTNRSFLLSSATQTFQNAPRRFEMKRSLEVPSLGAIEPEEIAEICQNETKIKKKHKRLRRMIEALQEEEIALNEQYDNDQKVLEMEYKELIRKKNLIKLLQHLAYYLKHRKLTSKTLTPAFDFKKNLPFFAEIRKHLSLNNNKSTPDNSIGPSSLH